ALDRLSRREHFTTPGDRAFCNVLGRTLDGSAVRKRFKRARDAAGLRSLRFHDLRHTYDSLLAAAGIDLVSIQAVMGHSAPSTTSRYLHARPATDQAAIFIRAFQPATSVAELAAGSDQTVRRHEPVLPRHAGLRGRRAHHRRIHHARA